MNTVFFIFFIALYFGPTAEGYIIPTSCPPGCECFQRNAIVECREAHLKEIPRLKFANDVKRLVLRGNKIENIKPDSLKAFGNLEYLDLNDNEMSTLSDKVFVHNPMLKEINLGLNPFRCDCDLRGFIKWLQTSKEKRGLMLRDVGLTNCAAPQAFVGRPLLGITFQDKHKNEQDETMFIGEEDNRGIAICSPKQNHAPRHAMLKAKPRQTPATKMFISTPRIQATKDKKKSTNIVLIITAVTAAVLVTCVTLASAVKYLLKHNRWMNYQDTLMDLLKRKTPKREPSTLTARIKKQRRASCGYAASDCSSDEESSSPHKKKGKDGYTAVPTTEPLELEDVSLNDSG